MSKSAPVWRTVEFGSVISPQQMRAVLVGLASLNRQPRLVLEATAEAGRISWRIGADDDVALRKACLVVSAHLPDVRLTPNVPDPAQVTTTDSETVAAQVRISRSRYLPLGDRDSDAVTRSLLAALAQAGQREIVQLQVVLGSRTWPHPAPQRTDAKSAALDAKHSQHGFGCAIRIAATSSRSSRAGQLVAGIGAALRGLETPGAAVTLSRVGRRSVETAGSPFLWPLWLSVDDLTGICGWPVTGDRDAVLPGMPPLHPKLLPALPVHKAVEGGIRFGLSTASLTSGREVAIGQPVTDGLRHRHIMGPTGVGKSTLLAHLILQDIEDGRGVVAIDPKADLVDDLLARIPAGRATDVVVLDPASPSPVGLNPLHNVDPDLAADSVVAVFHSLFGAGLGPRSTDILHAAVLTLARRGDASLVMVPLLLTNPGFRRSVIGHQAKADPLGLGAFWAGFEGMSDAEREHATRPLLNKLRQVMLRPSLRGIFGQRTSKFDLTDVFTGNKILLVKLGKDRIGHEASALLGSLLVSHLWQTILARTATPADKRHPVGVYIDEVQDYLRLPGSLADALAQARGLGVGLTAAHQHRGQLGNLLDDIDANTATKLFFRLSASDARAVASNYGSGQLVRDDFQLLPSYQAYAQLLIHGETTPWVSLSTQPLPPALRDPAVLQAASAARYGQPLDQVESDLLDLITPRTARTARTAGVDPATPEATDDSPRTARPDVGRRRRAATGNREDNPESTETNKEGGAV